ncbi:MAG: hypothetical protein AB7K09_05080 [Planctomycetota bacterium]
MVSHDEFLARNPQLLDDAARLKRRVALHLVVTAAAGVLTLYLPWIFLDRDLIPGHNHGVLGAINNLIALAASVLVLHWLVVQWAVPSRLLLACGSYATARQIQNAGILNDGLTLPPGTVFNRFAGYTSLTVWSSLCVAVGAGSYAGIHINATWFGVLQPFLAFVVLAVYSCVWAVGQGYMLLQSRQASQTLHQRWVRVNEIGPDGKPPDRTARDRILAANPALSETARERTRGLLVWSLLLLAMPIVAFNQLFGGTLIKPDVGGALTILSYGVACVGFVVILGCAIYRVLRAHARDGDVLLMGLWVRPEWLAACNALDADGVVRDGLESDPPRRRLIRMVMSFGLVIGLAALLAGGIFIRGGGATTMLKSKADVQQLMDALPWIGAVWIGFATHAAVAGWLVPLDIFSMSARGSNLTLLRERIVAQTGDVAHAPTRTLWRPVGRAELELIRASGWREFPPRLPHQPIFYPVLNREYAEFIARDWNTTDEASGYEGFVTEFDIDAAFVSRYREQLVGDDRARELWVPADELADFNVHLVGPIRVVASFAPPGAERDIAAAD